MVWSCPGGMPRSRHKTTPETHLSKHWDNLVPSESMVFPVIISRNVNHTKTKSLFYTKPFFSWLLFQYFNNVHSGLFGVTREDGSKTGGRIKEDLILILQTFCPLRNAASQIKVNMVSSKERQKKKTS